MKGTRNSVKDFMSWLTGFLAPFRMTLIILLWLIGTIHADTPAILEVGKFSAAPEGESLPEGWKPLTFPKIDRHTVYMLVKDEGTSAVKATSKASASGLTRQIKINPKEYPIISWRWKVTSVLKNGDVTKKEGDDYPARIYITFEYDSTKVGFFEKAKFGTYKLLYGQYPPIGALNYIWESKAPKGTIVSNPFTARAKMIIVESGSALLNQWLSEERDLYDDYKKAFGEEPPMLSGVAIMTDTDNTGEATIAYYGDIVFKKRS
jgi:hypothetical protein